MRDSGLGEKMAVGELKFEAPLAQFEEAEDWGSLDFNKTATGGNSVGSVLADLEDDVRNSNSPLHKNHHNNLVNASASSERQNNKQRNNKQHTHHAQHAQLAMDDYVTVDNGLGLAGLAVDMQNVDNVAMLTQCATNVVANAAATVLNCVTVAGDAGEDNFLAETFSGSLEDLVNTFDDKITKCFCNYDESVEKLAPVQVRTQDEIMNECQMWWTITGNFGNILPIDWSKSCARKLHMPALNLNECKDPAVDDAEGDADLSSEDEAVAHDLDMHSLILSGLHADAEPVKTADEVIREIDDMMQETQSQSPGSEESILDAVERKGKEVLSSPLYEEKLKTLSVSQLNELYLELEVLIREFSETLIAELALRDELEEEKELKNSFISLLLAVQNRRRQHHVDKKRNSRNNGVGRSPSMAESKYLTTVIPYHMGGGPPTGQALQFLIKILKAINEDSPTVPALLTDYILKVLCPT